MKRNKILFKSFMSGVIVLVMVLCFSVEGNAQQAKSAVNKQKKAVVTNVKAKEVGKKTTKKKTRATTTSRKNTQGVRKEKVDPNLAKLLKLKSKNK